MHARQAQLVIRASSGVPALLRQKAGTAADSSFFADRSLRSNNKQMGQGSNGSVEEGELAELKALLQRSTLFAETNPHIHVVPSTAK